MLYMYMYRYRYRYLCIYIIMKTNQAASLLSTQRLCVNSCPWAHDNHISFAQMDELPESHYGDNREGALLS